MIEIKDLNYSYKRSGHKVFENFSLSLEENRIYGLLGKNGTGKSTLLYLISGLLFPKKGSILVDGMKTTQRRAEMLNEMFLVSETYNCLLHRCRIISRQTDSSILISVMRYCVNVLPLSR